MGNEIGKGKYAKMDQDGNSVGTYLENGSESPLVIPAKNRSNKTESGYQTITVISNKKVSTLADNRVSKEN